MASVFDALRRWWALTTLVTLVCLGGGAPWAATQTPIPNLWKVALVAGTIGITLGVFAAIALERLRPAPTSTSAPNVEPRAVADVTVAAPTPTRAPRIELPRRPDHATIQRRRDTTPRIVKPPQRH